MSDVRVAGTGLTPFGNSPERTGRDLFAEASITAFEASGVPRDDVEAVLYGNFMGELSEHQGHQGPLMAEAAGVQAPRPATNPRVPRVAPPFARPSNGSGTVRTTSCWSAGRNG